MNRRRPVRVIEFHSKKLAGMARRLLGELRYHEYFTQGDWLLFCVNQKRGTTYYDDHMVTVPEWAIVLPQSGDAVRAIGYRGPLLERFWVYYLAHELAHMLTGKKAAHGPRFMKTLIEICPPELQFFELGYKPRNAKAAGISRGS